LSSIRKRFLISAVANAGRAAISLAVGLLVARGLGPADYGNLAYLLGSFWAIRALLDMGSSSAFYTLIAQRGRSFKYYGIYFAWLAFQFLFSLALVVVFLPSTVVEQFWLGLDRDLIVLALLATFLQNQVWMTVVQMHEAVRKTVRIQVAGVLIILSHLILVCAMLLGDWLSVSALLWAIVGEYFVMAVWLVVTLRVANAMQPTIVNSSHEDWQSVFKAYAIYCRPMAVIAVFTFAYEMVDRWLLQRYGGASQQGFYQVAAQLSTISLLAASSILNIFWKEIAEANERGAHERVAGMYRKTTQSLVFVAAFVTCFLVPWSETLVETLLGRAFHSAWPVLALMLFYPIHQTVGQINGTLFMATGRNSVYMKLTVIGLLASIPVSYVLIGPSTGWAEIGLGLGAMGMAVKIVGLNFLFVNIQSWVISRHYGISFEWIEPLAAILILLLIGFSCKFMVGQLHSLVQPTIEASGLWSMLMRMSIAGVLYLAAGLVLVTQVPSLAGMQQDEVRRYWAKFGDFFRRMNG
jgi:O-antigen/teichoic acid export membrane protein